MKKRDLNILLSQKGEIKPKTTVVSSKKIYDRKKQKLDYKKYTVDTLY